MLCYLWLPTIPKTLLVALSSPVGFGGERNAPSVRIRYQMAPIPTYPPDEELLVEIARPLLYVGEEFGPHITTYIPVVFR